jgi:hypothetical protein
MTGCGKRIEVTVPTRYSAKTITVKCGSTSPYGSPWLCDKCEEINAGRDWRREAIEAGETWGPEDY